MQFGSFEWPCRCGLPSRFGPQGRKNTEENGHQHEKPTFDLKMTFVVILNIKKKIVDSYYVIFNIIYNNL